MSAMSRQYALLATLESSGIGAASVLTVGTATYMVLTREHRELMREWVIPLHDAIHRPLGLAEQTDPRRYLHIPKNFSDDDAEIRIDLPRHLGFSRDVVADLITQKLAPTGLGPHRQTSNGHRQRQHLHRMSRCRNGEGQEGEGGGGQAAQCSGEHGPLITALQGALSGVSRVRRPYGRNGRTGDRRGTAAHAARGGWAARASLRARSG
ncbi:hypothetical protein ACPMJQ_28390 [Streptomyces pseudogriseolus]|uniref:hypothetical protein n=1 Tax=Streptomyces pseudogriseolus TaxID=36817 RepID=UPI003FA1AE4C